MRKIISAVLILTTILAVFCPTANAHQLSTGFLTANVAGSGEIDASLQLRAIDLERSIGLDRDKNQKLTWGEVVSGERKINDFLVQHLSIMQKDRPCEVSKISELMLDEHFDEPYIVIPFSASCLAGETLDIVYTGLYDTDETHKLLATFNTKTALENFVFSASSKTARIAFDGSLLNAFLEFVKQGVIHIWIGLDHILFLFALLLAVVFSRKNIALAGDHAESKDSSDVQKQSWIYLLFGGRAVFFEIVKVVTAFTIAHSVTLTLTAMGLINLPSKWVEVAIAVSVLLTALNNIFPIVKKLALITLGFGLLHGMGFAGVLGELGLPEGRKLVSILAFNLGVEIGQLVIVVVAVPVMLLIQNLADKLVKNKNELPQPSTGSKWILIISSIAIVLVSIKWIAERV